MRSYLAQVLLGWALALDIDAVMEVVTEGISKAEKRAGKPHGSWARSRGITGPWGRV